MAYKPKILAFAGSLRKDSYNKKLVKIAARGAEQAGGEVTYIDLNDFPMPILNQDDESASGLPSQALVLKKMMWETDGYLIASPEYNSSLSAVLKNTIDWTSRPATKEEESLSCFKGKYAAIMSASPGGLGGLRGLVHLRAILENIFVMVLPLQKCIAQAMDAFDSEGHLKNEKQRQEVEDIGYSLVEMIKKLKA